MNQSTESLLPATPDAVLDKLLNERFAGKVVRKDLTKLIKEGANVPVYVLEYLLGMYCASDDAETIRAGMETVKNVLAENYVRPDEAEKVKSKPLQLSFFINSSATSVTQISPPRWEGSSPGTDFAPSSG